MHFREEIIWCGYCHSFGRIERGYQDLSKAYTKTLFYVALHIGGLIFSKWLDCRRIEYLFFKDSGCLITV